jgi:hypothetical protein
MIILHASCNPGKKKPQRGEIAVRIDAALAYRETACCSPPDAALAALAPGTKPK